MNEHIKEKKDAAAAASSPSSLIRNDSALLNLKPLRDLSLNFDIDISSCLEDYLNELSIINNANTTSNPIPILSTSNYFTQGAILLQNSSSVYSRKVEYLHGLVYAALTDLSTKHKQQQQTQQQHTAKDKRKSSVLSKRDKWYVYDPERVFHILHDVIVTSESLCLKESDGDGETLGGGDDNRLSETKLSLGRLDVTRMERGSFGRRRSSVSHSKKLTLFSLNNMAAGEGTGEVAFRLVNGDYIPSWKGALRMHGGGSEGRMDDDVMDDRAEGHDVMEGHDDVMEGHDDVMEGNDDVMEGHDDVMEGQHHLSPAKNGVGFELHPDFQAESHDAPTNEHITQAPSPPPSPPKKDPWALLDPHQPSTTKPKKLRVGKTYVLPACLAEPPSHSVTGSSTRVRYGSSPTSATSLRNSRRRPLPTPQLNNYQLVSLEAFDRIVKIEEKRLTSRRRESLSSNNNVNCNEQLDDKDTTIVPKVEILRDINIFGNEFEYIAKATAKRQNKGRLLIEKQQKKDDPSSWQSKKMELDDDDFELNYDNREGDIFLDNDDNHQRHLEGEEEANITNANFDEAFGLGSEYDNKNNDDHYYSDRPTQTFEELCRAHIKAFTDGAEKYVVETKLSKRVNNWHTRLVPILSAEEEREVFDISVYGRKILNRVMRTSAATTTTTHRSLKDKELMKTNNNAVVDFGVVTAEGAEAYEVSRLFLASLMLANSGSISLQQESFSNMDLLGIQLEDTK